MKLTNEMRKAGIVKILSKLATGGYLCRITIGKAQIDGSYQRTERKAHTKRIAAAFDVRVINLPLCSFRGGEIWTADGNHTIRTLSKQGFKEFEVEMFFDLVKED